MKRTYMHPMHFVLAILAGLLIAQLLTLAVVQPAHAAGFFSGTRTCPSSGTQRLSTTSIKASWVVIQSPLAPTPNTGRIHFGNSSVTTSLGVYINPGDSYNFPPQSNTQAHDLSQIYIACTVTSDIVNFDYAQ